MDKQNRIFMSGLHLRSIYIQCIQIKLQMLYVHVSPNLDPMLLCPAHYFSAKRNQLELVTYVNGSLQCQ